MDNSWFSHITPTPKKLISSIHDWILAFTTYTTVLATADPSRGPDLLKYTRLIVQAEGEYRGDPWLRYDIAFCTRATNRHFQWADIDSALWNRTFSGMSKATSYCSICLDSTHATYVRMPFISPGASNMPHNICWL